MANVQKYNWFCILVMDIAMWWNSLLLIIFASHYLGHLCCDMFKIAMSPLPSLLSHFQEARMGEGRREGKKGRENEVPQWQALEWSQFRGQSVTIFFPRGSDSVGLEWIPGTTVFNPHSRHFLLEFGPQMDFLSRTNFSSRPPFQAVFCLGRFSLCRPFISISPKSTSCRPFLHLCPFPHTQAMVKPLSSIQRTLTESLSLFWLAPAPSSASSSMF